MTEIDIEGARAALYYLADIAAQNGEPEKALKVRGLVASLPADELIAIATNLSEQIAAQMDVSR